MTTRPPFPLEEARKIFPPMWTIYKKPKDFPDKWVVRMWWGETPDSTVSACDSLEIARELIQRAGGCYPLHRSLDDDQSIVETWL